MLAATVVRDRDPELLTKEEGHRHQADCSIGEELLHGEERRHDNAFCKTKLHSYIRW